ncbi:SIMPL domain-containing protein [Limnofasciculus baicalensis]|uniref:SIMPL domain-containing protein n=1 Tax=Limnofasciculus baicalensis BBK-W-15 TaxID=2699891 RepID=A0AAE3KQ11_9CYAN|nr:SIMPL domain-containing protein [Limnofasciculus baicalensis]MCP2732075.1 SIMPL domain-containing protein [Limnofasciculus baicalensis BBK-W-15]
MNCSIISSFHGKTIALILGLLTLTACQSTPTQVEMRNLSSLPRTISVSGKGEINIPTTMTQVRLGVEVQGKTAQEVQKEVAVRSQAVVDLLKSRQVDKLETTGISLNPNYTYKDGKQTINGYSGTNTVSFRIETEKSGTLLDDTIKAGATRIDGISFVASDEAIAQAQQNAIAQASNDAKKKAEAALTALNLKSKEVIGVSINGANPPQPLPYAAPTEQAIKTDSLNANTPVVGGEQKVEQSVTLQIRY